MIESHHRHILWDWNGTLLDDLALCVSIVNDMLAARGLPAMDVAAYQEHFDFPVRRFYERVGFDLSNDGFLEVSREFIAAFDARRLEPSLHDDAQALLQHVQETGRAQSILSAHRQSTLHEIVKLRGIDAHFTHMAGLDDALAHGKIDRGHLLLADLAIDPRSVLLVGDTTHDLEVARALGIDCVLVARGHHSKARLSSSGARVIDSLKELL